MYRKNLLETGGKLRLVGKWSGAHGDTRAIGKGCFSLLSRPR